VILFAGRIPPGNLFRVSAAGGEPVAVTQLQKGSTNHRVPQFLPGGRNFLFYVQGAADVRGVYAGSLDGGEPHRLLDAEVVAATYIPGYMLFVREETLFAQKFDPVRLDIAGDPFTVAEHVGFDASNSAGVVSTSASGTLAYRTVTETAQRQLVWFDRSGREVGRVGVAEAALNNPELSPDGQRVAVQRSGDIWLIETARGVRSRFTFDAALDYQPVWSPDGSQIVFTSTRQSSGNLYRKPTSGAANEELLLENPQSKTPTDWSPDGRFLLYRGRDLNEGNYDIWALPLDRERKPFPVVQTDFDEREGQFSPNGKWVAYQSNESGRFEIYVQPFPGPGGKWQVSANGGAQPRWRRDGKELFYIGLDGRLMAAAIAFPPGGQTVEAGPPMSLFATRIVGGALQGAFRAQYAVSNDGQRFLINSYTEEAATPPITVILNWHPEPGK
jgi:Tol biopolymer transport system component